MNDAVDQLIAEREAMDHGFPGGLVLSVFAHLVLVAAAVAAPLLQTKQPPLRVMDGFSVPMPPGGGGPRNPEPPAPAQAPEPANAEPVPAPEPPPKVIKPPAKSEPPRTKGLPLPDAKKDTKKKAKEEPRRSATEAASAPAKAAAKGGAPGGTGTSPATPGLEFGPPGPGVPGGTDWLGDWYLAGVQRKIWSVWMQQVRTEFTQPITVQFTILQDGSLGEVSLVESSGVTLLDLAAKRAIYSAAPFGPLPRSYGKTSYTIQAVFKPAS